MRRHSQRDYLVLAFCLLTMVGCTSEMQTEEKKVTSEKSQIEQIKQDAEKGNAEAQFELSRRYGSGNGVVQDYSQSFEWLLKSAESGKVEAMIEVARRYENGIGVLSDGKAARRWWWK